MPRKSQLKIEKILAFDRQLGLSVDAGMIDEEAGVIRGVSIATANVEALGHGEYDEEGNLVRPFMTDSETLTSILQACERIGEPLKVKLEHGSGLQDIVGELRDFRIDGDNLRGDFYAYESSKHKSHLFTIAKRLSKQFGLSISAYLTKVRSGAVDLMRCTQILSADFVDEPAINAALFSQKPTKTKNNMTPEEMKAALADAMKPLEDRLSKLEAGYSDKEKMAEGEAKEKEDMSAKILSLQNEIETQKQSFAELSKIAEEAKQLGVKFGASRDASAEESKTEKTFASELSRLQSEGKTYLAAMSHIREHNFELMQAEAKKRGLPSVNML